MTAKTLRTAADVSTALSKAGTNLDDREALEVAKIVNNLVSEAVATQMRYELNSRYGKFASGALIYGVFNKDGILVFASFDLKKAESYAKNGNKTRNLFLYNEDEYYKVRPVTVD